VVGAWILILW